MTTIIGRHRELLQLLQGHRDQILADRQCRLQRERAERAPEGRDVLEDVDADTQRAIGLTLLEATSERLAAIDRALERLEAGTYGCCVECTADIAEPRLRALPFAIRCCTCEQERELRQAELRAVAYRRAALNAMRA